MKLKQKNAKIKKKYTDMDNSGKVWLIRTMSYKHTHKYKKNTQHSVVNTQ